MERLNTYDTVPVRSLPAADLATARAARVVAFASPSAVKAWLECAGSKAAADMAVACIGTGFATCAIRMISLRSCFSLCLLSPHACHACCAGSTSAQAAERLGLKRVYYSESPGLDGFIESILEALEACTARSVPA